MRRPIDICHVATMAGWGGVERSLLDFLTLPSTDLRFHHALATSSLLPEIRSSLAEAGATYYVPSRRFRYDPTAILQLANWIRRQKIPLVHTYNGRANAWGNIVSLLANTESYVAGERGSAWSINQPLLGMNRLAYERATAIVANSHASKKMILHRYGVDESKIYVVANFVPPLPQVDVSRIRMELGLADSDVVVGSVGRVAPEKNYQTFVDAAAQLLRSRPRLKFVLVGGGNQLNFVTEYIESLGIGEQFLLTGYRADARELLQTFDIFVSTSLWESFGNALAEAALAGIPVVAPAIDGIPEVVIDGRTGILLEPTEELPQLPEGVPSKVPNYILVDGQISRPLALNADELSEAISQLLASPDLRAQYGAAARDRACELFTFGRYQRDLESIYEACLSSA